jgi:hypothetical protein
MSVKPKPSGPAKLRPLLAAGAASSGYGCKPDARLMRSASLLRPAADIDAHAIGHPLALG